MFLLLQYTLFKWDSQGPGKICPTKRMSQLTESPYKWGFGKKSENVPVIELFSIQKTTYEYRRVNKNQRNRDFHYYFQRHNFINLTGKI